MKRYVKLYGLYLKNSFKILRLSTANFIVGFVAFLAVQISSLFFLSVTFGRIPEVNGYNFYQVLFIYGFAQIPRGLDHFYSDYLWIFSKNSIVKGEMDRYLVRPVSPYFQVICERVQYDALGEIVVGVALTLYALRELTFPNPMVSLILGIFYLITGCIIYTSIKTIVAALAFWLKRTIFILQAIYGLSNLTQYPLSIYPKGVQAILIFIVPFGVVSFLPATVIFTSTIFNLTTLVILGVTTFFVLVAMIIWKKGVMSYESAGN